MLRYPRTAYATCVTYRALSACHPADLESATADVAANGPQARVHPSAGADEDSPAGMVGRSIMEGGA